MNPIERRIRRVDAFQQRHTASAFVFGVVKKFGDDNGGSLVANLAHSAFGTVFPLLLLLVTILGLVLGSHPGLRHDVVDSAVRQFPIIGNNLAKNISTLHRHSAVGLAVGIIGLLWGSLGLAQSGVFTMEQVWNLPGPQRPNYVTRLGRSLVFLAILAVGTLVGTFLAGVVPAVKGATALAVVGAAASATTNTGQYLLSFRVLTPKAVPTRALVAGSIVGGIGWTVLQALGGYVVGHFLRNDSAVYGMFAIVLGLFAWIYFLCELTVYAAELNVVLAGRLWPRAIVQPPLTEADQRSMAAQARQNRRRPEQHVEVSFSRRTLSEDEFLALDEHQQRQLSEFGPGEDESPFAPSPFEPDRGRPGGSSGVSPVEQHGTDDEGGERVAAEGREPDPR